MHFHTSGHREGKKGEKDGEPAPTGPVKGRPSRKKGTRRVDIARADEKRFRLIPGFHAVREALIRNEPKIDLLLMARGKGSQRAREILGIAEEKGIPVRYQEGSELDRVVPGVAHQGIVARAEKFLYADPDAIMESASEAPGFGLIIAADHITDEGNLGALIRTAAFFGAHGLIVPKDRSAGVTERVQKRSAGACAHLPVARVVNLGRTLDALAQRGFWIIGAAGEAAGSIYQFDWARDLVLVMGREDKGIGRSIRARCHDLVCIPGAGRVESLNVSVAAGAILSEVVRQTRGGA